MQRSPTPGRRGMPEITDILSRFGKVRVSEYPYPVFGNGAGVSRRRKVTEYLFHLKRGRG